MATVVDKSHNNPTDLKLDSPNRSAATTAAVMALTPLYPGELVRTLDAGLSFMGLSATSGAWVQVYADF